MSCRNVHLNEVHLEESGVQKSKARGILDLVDKITDKDSAAYLREICIPFFKVRSSIQKSIVFLLFSIRLVLPKVRINEQAEP